MPGDQPRFLNAVAVGETTLDARALLGELLGIERDAGRERPYAGAARTLDLDLILFGDDIIDEPRLPCRIRGSGSGDSCSSRWPRLRQACRIR